MPLVGIECPKAIGYMPMGQEFADLLKISVPLLAEVDNDSIIE